MAQQFEYLVLELHCHRGPLGGIIRWYWHDAPDTHFAPDQRRTALHRLETVGDNGWELISVTPFSLEFGASGLAGATSDIEYLFKRPR